MKLKVCGRCQKYTARVSTDIEFISMVNFFFFFAFIFSCLYFLFYLILGYLAHFLVKRELRFYQDPFDEYFRRGFRCWIPLDVAPLVDFKFIEKPAELMEAEVSEIEQKLEKYFEKQIERSVKRKVKRIIWRGKMKKIAEENRQRKRKN